MKWLKIVSGMFLLALCSLVGASSPAFAVSDYSVTIDPTTFTNNSSIFPNCDSNCLSDYNYIKVEFSDMSSYCNFNIKFYTLPLNSTSSFFSYFSPTIIYFSDPLDFTFSSTYCSASQNVTITLMEDYAPGSPTGSITLTENGTYDVTQYSEAIVDVPPTIEPGDYHDDLVNIKQAIITCASVVLVIYFFYCIYRIIIKAGKR